jgi:hypothetical protein
VSVLIPLYQHRAVAAHAIVDAEDAEWLGEHRWLLSAYGYAVRYTGPAGRTCVRMHREILGLESDDRRQGDHINRDRLDNRRKNLRIVSAAENRQNLSNKGRSRFRGVHFDTETGRWRARVKHEGRTYNLGRFDTEDEAGAAASAFRARVMPFAVEAAAS